MDYTRIPSAPLRVVALQHHVQSRPLAAAPSSKNVKWERFGVPVQQYISMTPPSAPLLSTSCTASVELSEPSVSSLLREPRKSPGGSLPASHSTDSPHHRVPMKNMKGTECSLSSVPTAKSALSSSGCPAEAGLSVRGALEQFSSKVGQVELERRCGDPQPKATPLVSSFFKNSKWKNLTNNEKTSVKRKRLEPSEGAPKKKKRGKKDVEANAVRPPPHSKSTSVLSTLPSPQGTVASGTQVPYDVYTSHEEASALFSNIQAALEDPGRIQAPRLFCGVFLQHQGVSFTNFTAAQDLAVPAVKWRHEPKKLFRFVHRYGFRWQDKVLTMVPEVAVVFILRVLRQLIGVEVITFNAPVVLIPLIVHTDGALHSGCLSDVRVMAWMSGSYSLSVFSQYTALYTSAMEQQSPLVTFGDPMQDFVNQIYYLAPLYKFFYAHLGSRSLLQPFLRQEKRISLLIVQMKCTGILVDMKAVRRLKERCLVEMESAKRRAAEMLQEMPDFNIQSSDQCRQALYEVLHLGDKLIQSNSVSTTKTGKLSTAEETLRLLAPFHELPKVIIQYRKAAKIIQNYVDGMMQMAVPYNEGMNGSSNASYDLFGDAFDTSMLAKDTVVDDTSVLLAVLYPNFIQEGTDTGRLSCTEPNFQNLPRVGPPDSSSVDTGEDVAFRQCFIAPREHSLVSVDYEQIELRILAHLSGDPSLLETLSRFTDIHLEIAKKIFQKSSISSEERSIAKRMVFGTLYGAGVKTMAAQMNLTHERASSIASLVHASFPQVGHYRRTLLENSRSTGCVRTLSGRLRSLPDLNSIDALKRSYAERQAFNTCVQGSAADVMKLAMLAVERSVLAKRPWKEVQLVSQIHDELVFNIPTPLLPVVIPEIEAAMTSAASLRVPLPVTVKYGPSLGSLAPWTVDNELGLLS